MRILGLLIILILIVLGVSFAILNSDAVHVNYYFGADVMPLSLLIIGTLIVGIILGWLVMILKVLKVRMENRRLRKRVEQLEKSITTVSGNS